jgi:hypothetical protein
VVEDYFVLRDVIDLRGNSVYKWDEMGRECII